MAKIVKLQQISLKDHPELNEKVIQDCIFEDPSILGLGDLTALQKERIQPTGGRLDILLTDESNTRYEMELQLGETDPSHIIRTIEYWDAERKRFPQYDHCAIIAAEEITGRFLNVISLFNGNIPLIALQVSAFKISDDKISLVFTKVMDRVTLGTDEEEVFEPTDRKYWEKKSTTSMLSLMDDIFNSLDNVSNEFMLKYNKFYIGMSKDGVAKNFISFKPKKNYLWLKIKCVQSEEINNKLDGTDIVWNYDNRWRQYSVRINKLKDYLNNKELIDLIIAQARDHFNV